MSWPGKGNKWPPCCFWVIVSEHLQDFTKSKKKKKPFIHCLCPLVQFRGMLNLEPVLERLDAKQGCMDLPMKKKNTLRRFFFLLVNISSISGEPNCKLGLNECEGW